MTTFLQLLVYGLTNGAVVALSAVGFTLAYSVARQINLAHGNVFALTTVVIASLAGVFGVTETTPVSARIGLLALLVVAGAGCGAILNSGVERLAFRPFRGRGDRFAPLIASVGVAFILLQVAVGWYDLYRLRGQDVHVDVYLPLLSVPDLIPAVELGAGGVSFTLKDLVVLLMAAGVAAGGAALLARSRGGRLLRAVAEDAELAALCGADPGRAYTLAFAAAGALAGFGAVIYAVYYGGATNQHGLRSGLAAMTAAVLGGAGNPRGALAGGVALGIFTAFNDYLLDPRWTPVFLMLLLIGLLAFRPGGLLGRALTPASEDVAPAALTAMVTRGGPYGRRLLSGFLTLALVYPILDQIGGWGRLYSATTALLLVVLALGLSLVVGFAGLLDLGYAAFFAIGSYTVALLTASGSDLAGALPPALANPALWLPLAGLVAGGFGLAFGLPSVRTRGEYLAIVTLAFGEIVPGVILHLDWTGGPRGMSVVPPPRWLPGLPDSAWSLYLPALALAVVVYLAAARLAGARAGRAWAAVRDDEIAAAAVGISPWRAKLLAFTAGAGFAGVAGGLYAGLAGSVQPERFDLTLSVMVLAAVVIGGRWGLPGVVAGALAIAAYDLFLLDLLNAIVHGLGAALRLEALTTLDLRAQNFALFGLALYLATLPRQTSPRGDPRAVGKLVRRLPRFG
jgi:branched-chain amino acid transport system permease protein